MATQPYIPGDRFAEIFPDRPGLLTAKDVARMLAVSEKTVYCYVSKGLIPFIKIETNVRFSPKRFENGSRKKQ